MAIESLSKQLLSVYLISKVSLNNNPRFLKLCFAESEGFMEVGNSIQILGFFFKKIVSVAESI